MVKNRIYYFTGTGNSMRAARIIGERLGETEIVSMRTDPEDEPATECEIVGFVFPVYHWTIPEHARAYIERLEINSNAYVFAVAMPSFICGVAFEVLAGILKKKQITLSYGNVVYSVANYAIVYPPFPPAGLRVPRTEKKLKQIAGEIAERQYREYPRVSQFIKRRREKVMVPYLELQRYADYPFTISSDCISCGLCSRVCPCSNIDMSSGKPVFRHHCANCMACVVNCPKRAIGYEIRGKDRALLDSASPKTPLVKIMGLPKKRKLYRNPYITSADLTKNNELIQGDTHL